MYRNVEFKNPDSPEVAEIKREIQIWQKTIARIGAVRIGSTSADPCLPSEIHLWLLTLFISTQGTEEEEIVKLELKQKVRQLEAAMDQVSAGS